jgi:hypothetical protein
MLLAVVVAVVVCIYCSLNVGLKWALTIYIVA